MKLRLRRYWGASQRFSARIVTWRGWRGIAAAFRKAEVWSAVAAIGALGAAYMSYQQQVLTARLSIRPELLITDWETTIREPDKFSTAKFRTVENIGVGPAFNVSAFFVREKGRDPPEVEGCGISPFQVPVIRAGGKAAVEGSCFVRFPTRADGHPRMKVFRLDMYYSDSAGTRYCTSYELLLTEAAMGTIGEKLAPGLDVFTRRTGLFRECR
jgi:hypothetical protein